MVLLVVGAIYFLGGGTGTLSLGGPSVKEIAEKGLAYKCRWEGILHHYLGDVNIFGEYYFHGVRLKFVEYGGAGYTHYLDTNILDPKAKVYQWVTFKKDGFPFLKKEFTKEEYSPENFEEILKIVYTRQDEPFEKVLREVLAKTKKSSVEIKSVVCGTWEVNENMFQVPE